MTKLTSTILGLTLVVAFSVSEANAAPPVLVHNGVPVSYGSAYGTPGHSARTHGRSGTSRFGVGVRSPFSYGYNNLTRCPSNQFNNRPHGYGTINYGTLGHGYPASRFNTPGHGGLNLGLSYGSY